MADNNKPWVGMTQPNLGGRPPKHDYDDDEFYDHVFYLAFNGANNSEIANELNLHPDVFGRMASGTYDGWNEEENERRGKRLCRVLASAREKINRTVRARYLQTALGGVKVKSKVTRYIKGEEDQTLELVQQTETELAPNMQAMSTWLYHHDPDWRKVQRGFEPAESTSANADNIEQGVDISAWIEDHVTLKGGDKTGKKITKEDVES